MSPERAELNRLESEGIYVFHGSGEDLDVLEPQQAHNIKGGKRIEDGPPAVFATPAADYAVFMAVFSKKNCPLGRRSSVESLSGPDGSYKLRLRATENTLSQVDGRSSGWVYVFNRADFYQREPGGIEYTNRRPVTPLRKIRVARTDILGRVEVLK